MSTEFDSIFTGLNQDLRQIDQEWGQISMDVLELKRFNEAIIDGAMEALDECIQDTLKEKEASYDEGKRITKKEADTIREIAGKANDFEATAHSLETLILKNVNIRNNIQKLKSRIECEKKLIDNLSKIKDSI